MGQSTLRLAVLGATEATEAVRTAATGAGARLVDPAAADAVVAVGDAALREAAVAVVGDGRPADGDQPVADAPILPVGPGRHAVDSGSAPAAVGRLAGANAVRPDAFERTRHPVLAVDDGSRRIAAFDVAFLTAEPARISEYTLRFTGDEAASFRADGAVVATPLGSRGYAGSAGGPSVAPGGGISVVPVAPFTTRTDAWIVTDRVGVTVERETTPVSLVVDGTRRGAVEPHREVDVAVGARIELLSPARE